jgi:outer membrane protein assembly factor BamB
VLWRKDDFKAWPIFFTSSSPLLVDGLCVVQLGGQSSGAIVAYDLANGAEKWKWTGDGTAYASPALLTVDGAKVIVAETAQNIVALGLADGKLLWQTPFPVKGRGYNACTPIVDGQTVLYSGSGRGTWAVRVEKQGDKLTAKELWSNAENSVQYNTPVVKDGLVFGISERDSLFCISAQDGKTAWTAPIKGGRGYGSVVDAGSVLLALTPASELVVYEPSGKELKQFASYKVAESATHAYPIVAGNRIFVKDREALTLWILP